VSEDRDFGSNVLQLEEKACLPAGRFGGLGVSELRRLRQLEEENNRLKQIVADLTLDKQMLQDVLKKNL
jgi:cell shape-determining protein MreC